MFTSITSRAGALVTAIVVLSGGAILRGGAAAADPDPDDQFLALLDQQQIPALDNVPSLIAAAHGICRKLDGGEPVDALVDDVRKSTFTDPGGRQFPARRVTTTIDRFIIASVEAYCPSDESKIGPIMANRAPGSNKPMHGAGAYTHNAVMDADRTVLASLGGAVPVGETTPDPQIPAPPPTAQILTPPIVASPPPKQSPPPPKQSPPPPQQSPPPAVGPQPGDAPGSGGPGSGDSGGTGGGGSGGAGPAEPSPTPHRPPGRVRLAP